MTLSSKLMLWIFLIVTFAVSGLWLAGGQKIESSATINIAAAVDDVFPFLLEPEKLKAWVYGLEDVARLTPQDNSGSRSRPPGLSRTLTHDGTATQFDDEVIRYEKNELLSVQSTNSNQTVTSIFKLKPSGNETRLSCRVTITYHGIGRLVSPLKKDEFHHRKRIDENMRALKQLIESKD